MKLRLEISALLSGGFAGAAGFETLGVGAGVATTGLATAGAALEVPTGVPTAGLGVPTVGRGDPTGVPTVGLGVPTVGLATGVEVGF